jgi:hypothetical protein
MAQQASPIGIGQREFFRPQAMKSSIRVVGPIAPVPFGVALVEDERIFRLGHGCASYQVE